MTCAACARLIDAYADGELYGSELAEVRGHVLECTSCSHELDALKVLKKAMKEAPSLEAAPVELSTVRRRAARLKGRRSGVWGTLSLVAVVAAAAIGFWHSSQTNPQVSPTPDWTRIETASDSTYASGLDNFGADPRIATVAFTGR